MKYLCIFLLTISLSACLIQWVGNFIETQRQVVVMRGEP